MIPDQLQARLAAVRRRLAQNAEHAEREPPTGLTDPDPGASERWEASQVWAHLAEFVGYWHDELASIVRMYDGMPVPFGRVKTDAGRIAAIELGRHRPIAELAAQLDQSISRLVEYLQHLDEAAWQARGVHETVGVLDVPAVVDRFIVSHLEEHADQLDRLWPAAG
ncbi:MAG: hypothetical protein M3N29_00300 [Chloroflexota bacterium]|nr:hypothetical protein [Chloroflexota bacterium]